MDNQSTEYFINFFEGMEGDDGYIVYRLDDLFFINFFDECNRSFFYLFSNWNYLSDKTLCIFTYLPLILIEFYLYLKYIIDYDRDNEWFIIYELFRLLFITAN